MILNTNSRILKTVTWECFVYLLNNWIDLLPIHFLLIDSMINQLIISALLTIINNSKLFGSWVANLTWETVFYYRPTIDHGFNKFCTIVKMWHFQACMCTYFPMSLGNVCNDTSLSAKWASARSWVKPSGSLRQKDRRGNSRERLLL